MNNKKKNKTKNRFRYVVIAAVLFIPFMYSFFYLKAYWDPYGSGNIDNLPVAVVNSDNGNMGEELIKSIKDSKKLKLSVVSSSKATDGLNDGDYYAIINIPEDFTSNMESVSSTNKHHATITYSPNQKSNYLSSQIINTVVLTVEKSLDNKVNSEIVGNLSETVESVPNQLDTISSGFEELKGGTSQLADGSSELTQGTNILSSNYAKFNEGVLSVKNGTETLNSATKEFSSFSAGVDELVQGVATLKSGNDQFQVGLHSYVAGVSTTLDYTNTFATYVKASVCPKVTAGMASSDEQQLCAVATGLLTENPAYGGVNTITYLKGSGSKLVDANNTITEGINTLNTKVSSLSCVDEKITNLQTGIQTLANGASTLYNSSLQIQNGITALNNGAITLNSGITTLDQSVGTAKSELDSNISTTKKEVKKVNGLSEYSEEPIKIKTEEVNQISSYGTAFSPLFISIALWVGSLMMFIVLYYDKDKRFGILGIDSKERVKRTLAYHGLATLSGFVLGILLQLLLDFEITNIFLYYISIILISNCFLAIIEFFIGNFGDVGKFIALIILVLQLAASGGTFPIETVTKGFRFLNPVLPMTYTVRLLKEVLVSIESNLLVTNFIIVFVIFVIFFTLNIGMDFYRQKHKK